MGEVVRSVDGIERRRGRRAARSCPRPPGRALAGRALGLSVRAVLLAAALLAACSSRASPPAPSRTPDVRYEPSPPEVVREMLAIARVGPGDVVYDLGCGDGRVVVAAARLGARGVGVDIDPQRVREARANARAAGVEDRVEIREGDLFETDLSGATVVTLFLQPELNLRLRPRLRAQLAPGARVVSHWHDMGDWRPERTVRVLGRNVYLWTIPAAPEPREGTRRVPTGALRVPAALREWCGDGPRASPLPPRVQSHAREGRG